MSISERPPEEDKSAVVEEKVVLTNGDVIVRRYQKGRFLGKGGFARCYEFMALETKRIYAGKVVLKESLKKSRAKQKLMSEIKIHRSVQHAGIVNFEHFFEDSENVYILLEMCSNQTFSDLVRRRKRLTELEVQCYLLQMISALKYLQEHKIIHRDLKLGNLFLTEKMEAKVGDFGLATKVEFDGEKKHTICGTPNYIAPEVLDSRAGHSYEVDVWSLGVILYAMLIGKPPFETADVKTTYKRIRMCVFSFPESVPLSPQVRSLITRILVADPAKRPSYDEILAHDFLNQGNSIPKLMPSATISCPPSDTFLQQYQLNGGAQTDRETAVSVRPLTASSTERHWLAPMAELPLAPSKGEKVISQATDDQPTIWVAKWVDYSSKYGLGYELNNSSIGVFFNDSTKIVLGADNHQFLFAEKKHGEKVDTVAMYTLAEFPKALQKKVTLLQHFRSYLEGDDARQDTAIEELHTTFDPIYVKKWIKTKHAVLFRFSNKVIQVIFQDRTELLISGDTKILTYVDKRSQRSGHTMASAMEGRNQEIAKRLKYTKDLLAHMLGKEGPATSRKS